MIRRTSSALLALASGALVLAASAPAAAVSYTFLKSGSGDGYAAFYVDEVGFFLGCGGPADPTAGLQFDPLGPAPQQNTNCNTQLYVLDVAGKRRQPLINTSWAYFLECGGDPGKEHPIDMANILSDTLIGTHKRVTVFTMPSFPEVKTKLTQRAAGNTLTQVYAFANSGAKDLKLRLVRVADLDLEYTGNFTTNLGGPYGANGARVLDEGQTASVAITAEGGTFEGWRIYQNTGGAAAAHSTTWVHFGYTPDQLNGYFVDTIGGFPAYCDAFGKQNPTAINRDTAAIVQSEIVIPAGGVAKYTTLTIAEPGITLIDSDGDGIPDEADGCPNAADASDADTDEDGIGDACDNCAALPNPLQEDSDADGIGDVCELVLGTPCADAASCGSNECVEGVCCDSPCPGPCSTCLSPDGMNDGICTALTGPSCDDSDACTQVDACVNGACVGASPISCPSAPCVPSACDPATGECVDTTLADGAVCDDGNACTSDETCASGACVAGTQVTCDAPDACHLPGACNPDLGMCVYPNQPAGTPCDDGNDCTVESGCTEGLCVIHAKLDGAPCAQGTCFGGACLPESGSTTGGGATGGGATGGGGAGTTGGGGASATAGEAGASSSTNGNQRDAVYALSGGGCATSPFGPRSPWAAALLFAAEALRRVRRRAQLRAPTKSPASRSVIPRPWHAAEALRRVGRRAHAARADKVPRREA